MAETNVPTVWSNSTRDSYTYDDYGNQITSVNEYWENNKWIYHHRTSYIYDNHQNLLTTHIQSWSGNKWGAAHTKVTYTYDQNDNLLTKLSQNLWTNRWVNDSRVTYTYDINNNLLFALYQQWTTVSNIFFDFLKCTYTYDKNGNLLTILYESLDNNLWSICKQTLTYDDDGNSISGQVEILFDSSWASVNGNLTFYYNHGQSSDMIYASRAKATYLNIKDVKFESPGRMNFTLSQNYPNPFNPSTTITLNLFEQSYVTLEIYNLQGEKTIKLLNQILNSGSHSYTFEAHNLPSGTYFYRLMNETGSLVKKMILMK